MTVHLLLLAVCRTQLCLSRLRTKYKLETYYGFTPLVSSVDTSYLRHIEQARCICMSFVAVQYLS